MGSAGAALGNELWSGPQFPPVRAAERMETVHSAWHAGNTGNRKGGCRHENEPLTAWLKYPEMCPASQMIRASSFSPLDLVSQSVVHAAAAATPWHVLKMQTLSPILDLLNAKLHFQQGPPLSPKAGRMLGSPEEV